jgi:hypothetical protein
VALLVKDDGEEEHDFRNISFASSTLPNLFGAKWILTATAIRSPKVEESHATTGKSGVNVLLLLSQNPQTEVDKSRSANFFP